MPLPRELVIAGFEAAFKAGESVFVRFRKRSDGSIREMTTRAVPSEQLGANVRSDLHAAGAGTLFVWDVEKNKPASVPLEGIESVVWPTPRWEGKL